MIKPFLCALSFFTIIPIPKSIQFSEKDFRNAVIFLPVISLIIFLLIVFLPGFMLFGLHLKRTEVTTLFLLLFWVLATGALHIDGFCDSVDGFSGGKDKESILRIMADSQIGAKGAVALFLLMMFKCFLLFGIRWHFVYIGISILMGRWMMALALSFGRYAKSDGLARGFFQAGPLHGILASLVAALVMLLLIYLAPFIQARAGFYSKPLAASVLLPCVLALYWYSYCKRRIGGMTGDTLGALCEMVEVVALLPVVYL